MPGLDDWPGELRRNPPRSSPTYAVRAPIAAWLRREAAARPGPYRVLDVGCGVKPYYPFFAERASEYVGVDVVESPAADLQGAVESLPVADGSFDLVLCIQVLEHAEDPAQAVRELRRVVAPGGRVLASTHGVQVYHPAPVDLWPRLTSLLPCQHPARSLVLSPTTRQLSYPSRQCRWSSGSSRAPSPDLSTRSDCPTPPAFRCDRSGRSLRQSLPS